MIPRTGRFTRSDRLRSSRDFQRVSREGRRVSGPHFVILVAPSRPLAPAKGGQAGQAGQEDGDGSRSGESRRRLGLTVSRRVGNAVQRNRVKRAVREWFRLWRWELEESIDLVVIARPGAARLTGHQIAEALCRQLKLTAPARGAREAER